ncbi:hypothetical protein SB861_62260, partial [Paraburkholderia sp. SIMBA_049]
MTSDVTKTSSIDPHQTSTNAAEQQYAMIDKALADTGYYIEKTDTHAGGSQLDEAHCKKLLTDKLS